MISPFVYAFTLALPAYGAQLPNDCLQQNVRIKSSRSLTTSLAIGYQVTANSIHDDGVIIKTFLGSKEAVLMAITSMGLPHSLKKARALNEFRLVPLQDGDDDDLKPEQKIGVSNRYLEEGEMDKPKAKDRLLQRRESGITF